jgi:allantoinase
MTRDLVGYGETPPAARWPGGARVAVNIVINYEEGSEDRVEDGQDRRESMGEAPSPVPAEQRDLANESFFEYGSRAGFWRLLRVLDQHEVQGTVFGCAVALERNLEAARAITARGWDICAHGDRWQEHYLMARDDERAAIGRAAASIRNSAGQAPLGWYCRYGPSVHTRELVAAEGSFLYDSDSYADDLPYWVPSAARPWLVIPYALDTNDIRYWRGSMQVADDFFAYLRDAFDQLWEEGAQRPRMMSVGLHCRIAGRPGRAPGLGRFLAHARSRGQIWFARRGDIARHWIQQHPPPRP